MSHAHRFFAFLMLFLVFSTEGAVYGHYSAHCQFSSYDGHDAVFLEQVYFNKLLLMQYNSSVGKAVGYTKTAQELADKFNSDESFISHQEWKISLCKSNAPQVYNVPLDLVEPDVWLRSVKVADSRHPAMLICSVYNFYPKQIRVMWLRDGKEATSDVTSTEELPDGNWFYQIHSYLEFTPKPGEKISCVVEHASLMEPKVYDWDPLPDTGMNKIIIGVAGMLLGLVFSVAGLSYYKKKTSGRVVVPTTEAGVYV
uniref:Ig-like domain-containing protein n=1 Tax=Amphilophus citrinellus TaxID=61819 RepID=A0A3Q0RZI6_AMPCI